MNEATRKREAIRAALREVDSMISHEAELVAEVERLNSSLAEVRADHHHRDRNRSARTAEDTIEFINSDQPCCIPIGDAVNLYYGIRKQFETFHSKGCPHATTILIGNCCEGNDAALLGMKHWQDVRKLQGELSAMHANHPEAACYGPTGPYPKLQARVKRAESLVSALDAEATAQPSGSTFLDGGLAGASRYNVVMWARRFVADYLKVNPAEPDLPPGHTRVDPAEGFGR